MPIDPGHLLRASGLGMQSGTGAMVLTTGNKSEYAVGYSTLYGDMTGGFAPIITDRWTLSG